jgi:hypothetical protein
MDKDGPGVGTFCETTIGPSGDGCNESCNDKLSIPRKAARRETLAGGSFVRVSHDR